MYRIHSSLLRSIRPVSRPRSCSPVFSNSLRGLHLSRSSFAASELLMPALSPTMTEGTILKWLKSEGDKVEPGEVLFEVETDKAQIEVEAPDEGILAKIMVKEGGSKVKVNTVIAYLMEEGDDIATFTPPQKSQTKSAEKPKPESSKPLASTPPPPPTSPPSVQPSVELSSNMSSSTPSFQRHLSPAVYHLLKSNNLLDMADKIPASGHKGRLLKGDIISYLEGKPVEPPKKHKPMSEVPPPQPSAPSKFVSQKQLELSQVLRSRKDVDVDGILTHAVAKALRDVPDVCKAIDTSMLTLAFDSPAGLRRSNIKNLGAKSVLDVANLLKELQSGRSSETLPPNTSSVTISKSPIPSSPFSIIIGPVKKVRDTTHFQLTDTDSHNMFLDYLTGSSSSFEPEVDPEQEGLTNHSDSSNAEESKTEDLYDFLSGVAPEVESGKMKKVVDVKIDIVRDKVNESAVGKFWDRLQHYLRVAQ